MLEVRLHVKKGDNVKKRGGGYKHKSFSEIIRRKKISFKSDRLFSVLKLEDEKHVSILRPRLSTDA